MNAVAVATTAAPASQAAGQAPPPVPGRTHRLLWLLRLVTTVTALGLITQPVLIGLFLQGNYPMLLQHGILGGIVLLLTWAQAVVAFLAWSLGRLPVGVLWVAGTMALVAPLQVGAGYARQIAVHIPLGVLLVALGVGLWAWTMRPGRARRSYQPRSRPVPRRCGGWATR